MAERMFNIQRSATNNASELQDFLKDLNDWEGDIKKKDDQLKNATPKENNDDRNVPPIRGAPPSKEKAKKKNTTKSAVDGTRQKDKNKFAGGENKENGLVVEGDKMPAKSPAVSTQKPSVPRDYRAWDKVNVDAMLAELDLADEEKIEQVESSSSDEEEEEDEDEELTEMQRVQKAIFEKERGNEFFKKGDYDRAIECYTTGIANDAGSAVLLANRAMALLKQEKYGAAEVDCSAALELDPSYVKALMRRGSARVALKKLEQAKTDFDDVLFLEPNNKQAHQELVKVKKLIDKKGFEKKSVDKEAKNSDNKSRSVRFVGDEEHQQRAEKIDVPKSDASTTAKKTSTERVKSRWVTPISKPPEAVSRKPMRRIKIEEVGLTKEEMEAKRNLEDKSKIRLNQMSESDLRFFKGIGEERMEDEEELKIDINPVANEREKDAKKAKIQVLGKKSNKEEKDRSKKTFGLDGPSAAKIQELPTSGISDTDQRKSATAPSDVDDNPLQRSRLSKGDRTSEDYWQTVARDLDPSRSATAGPKGIQSVDKFLRQRRDRVDGAGDAAEKPAPIAGNGKELPLLNASKSSSAEQTSLPPVPTTALQLQSDLQNLKKQSSERACRYLDSVPPASLPAIIKNMLDTDLVLSIVEAFHRSLLSDESAATVDVGAYLTSLTKTSRFDMAVMFLANKDKKTIAELIDRSVNDDDKTQLRKKFGL